MTDEGVLDDRTIGVFRNVERLRLKRACLRSSRLSASAFRQALCSHHLQELDASHLRGDITVSDILQGLSSSKECRQGLQRLTVTGVNLLRAPSDTTLRFSALRGLRCLGVAWTQLDHSGLEDICSLPLLESLDISGTCVTDLAPVLNLRARLRSLSVHGLRGLAMSTSALVSVLSSLELLRHLDVSNSRLVTDRDGLVRRLLEQPGILRSLVSLDVSGWRGLSDGTVQAFAEARRPMCFLGLLATGAGGSDFLSGEGNLKVAGEQTLAQLTEALRRYTERKSFLQEALRHLHLLISQLDIGPHPEILQLVCSAMQKHSDSASIQLVATACVFNLTSLELAQEMPLGLLGNVVQQVLAAMKNFPSNEQIQKNCLFSLCSDYILQVLPINRCETARQVMMGLSSYDNETLQRICVAVVSLLVSKLSVEELGQCGADEIFVKQLLSIVQQRATVGAVDSVLSFALTTLWNLTDERPYTCLLFLQCEGLELYMEVLETYVFDPITQKKVLGLLVNSPLTQAQCDLEAHPAQRMLTKHYTCQTLTLHLPITYSTPAKHLLYTCQTLTQHLPNTYSTPAKHLLNTCQTPTLHLPNTYSTPAKHLLYTCQTLTLHLPNTYSTPAKHLFNTCQTLTQHLPNTYSTPAKHLLYTCQTPTQHLPNTYSTPAKHLLYTCQTLTLHLPNTYSTPAKHLLYTCQTPTLHLPNTYSTPAKHLLYTCQTLTLHLPNTYHYTCQTLTLHLPNTYHYTCQTPTQHLSNTHSTPAKHLLYTCQTLSLHLPNTYSTPAKHLLFTCQTLTLHLPNTYSTPAKHLP
ncbi:protein zyg-11 homolog isoform X2 [Brachyhypopomus gauderio]